MSQTGIYAIQNNLNGKAYVGSAVTFRKRWSLHRCALGRGSHHARPLQQAWDKYGAEAFSFIVLEEVADPALLTEREQVWIDKYRRGNRAYNMARVAGSRLGMRSSPETRAKISAAAKGRKLTDEARANMRAAALARSPEVAAKIAASRPKIEHSPEARAAISAKLQGIVRSAETRAKIGAASRGRKHSDESKAKRLKSRRLNMAKRAETPA